MTVSDFAEILAKCEGPHLDFKSKMYPFGNEDEQKRKKARASFCKDIISMANTIRDENSYIIFGVKEYTDGRKDLIGLDTHIDDADLQSKLDQWVFPRPQFSYETINHEGKIFGVITIPPYRNAGPFRYMGKDNDTTLLKNRSLYFRRGTQNSEATPEEEKAIYAWFITKAQQTCSLPFSEKPWDDFVAAVDAFDERRTFLLITTQLESCDPNDLDYVGDIDWLFVMDFDYKSSMSGLLHHVEPKLIERRALHIVTKDDEIVSASKGATTWYFTRGIEGRETTLSIDSWLKWKKDYIKDFRDKISSIVKISKPPVTLIVFCYNNDFIQHIKSSIDLIYEEYSGNINIVISSNIDPECENIASLYEAPCYKIPLHQLLHGLHHFASNSSLPHSAELPSSSGAPLTLPPKDFAWIEEDLEIVHMNIGRTPDAGAEFTYDFRKGREVSWYDLALRLDIDRDITSKMSIKIRSSLESRRTERINLHHDPGAGGTTVASRLLWDFRTEFPCVKVKNCSSAQHLVERIAKLFTLTKLSVLAFADGGVVTDHQIDEISKLLTARNVPATFLLTHRSYDPLKTLTKNSFYLPAELSPKEFSAICFELGRDVPHKLNHIQQTAQKARSSEKTLFFMGLMVYESDYISLESYVKRHLSHITLQQKYVIVFLALAHYYGQSHVDAQFFAPYLGLPHNKPVKLENALGHSGLKLIVKEKDERWHPVHYLISGKILETGLASDSNDTRTWKNHLLGVATQFINICSDDHISNYDQAKDLIRQIFIYRNNSDMLGTEQSGNQLFSRIISDIPGDEGKLSVFKLLTERYPNDHHYWAHLGRFYENKMSDHINAIVALDKAISIDNSDPLVHHMKGMAYRRLVYNMINEGENFAGVVEQAKISADCFAESRALSPENDHGYISEIQMNIKILDYCGKCNDNKPVFASANSTDSWVREIQERTENLLLELRSQRQSEKLSHYELRCRADLDALYGDHGFALQTWQNLLDKNQVYAPPVRRQIVWTLLARNRRQWKGLQAKEIERSISLLQDNIQEEPGKSSNMRLWLQAIRASKTPPSIDTIIEKVAYWGVISDDINAHYYLYILYALQAFLGSTVAINRSQEALDKCRQLARFRRDRTKSFEWIGNGNGIKQLIHQSELGEWEAEINFWGSSNKLLKLEGVISQIRGPEGGTIEVKGMKAFFVPGVSGHIQGQAENRRVLFFLGFSYDGLRAWDVEDA